jgi:hypothetical protein
MEYEPVRIRNPHPLQVNIRIRIRVVSRIRIRIQIMYIKLPLYLFFDMAPGLNDFKAGKKVSIFRAHPFQWPLQWMLLAPKSLRPAI